MIIEFNNLTVPVYNLERVASAMIKLKDDKERRKLEWGNVVELKCRWS